MTSSLDSLHNTASGSLFMVGCGPSLLGQIDLLEHLRDRDTFCSNGFAKWNDMPFGPDYYGVGVLWRQDLLERMNPEEAFVTWPDDPQHDGWTWVPRVEESTRSLAHGQPFQGFGDTFGPLPTARTAPLTWIQMGVWLGYREFYLLGVELSDEGHCYDVEEPRLHSAGVLNPPIFENAAIVRQVLEEHGATIKDCTPQGKLHREGILDYMSLEDALAA